MFITLHGYQYSVYTRIVRMVLAARSIAYRYVEIDPFTETSNPARCGLHPFGRVPVIEEDGFVLYETAAICRYLDDVSGKVTLCAKAPRDLARMNQIIAITDNYGYWPMVRQVFSQGVFRVAEGGTPDIAEFEAGLATSRQVCNALEDIASGGEFLIGGGLSLADLHLGAMIAYFTAASEGQAMIATFPRLAAWWQVMRENPLLIKTDPGLPNAPRA